MVELALHSRGVDWQTGMSSTLLRGVWKYTKVFWPTKYVSIELGTIMEFGYAAAVP